MEKASLYLGRPRSPGAPPAAGADTTGPGSPVGLRPPFGPGPVVPSHPDRRAALILSVASQCSATRWSPPRSSIACSTTATSSPSGATATGCARSAGPAFCRRPARRLKPKSKPRDGVGQILASPPGQFRMSLDTTSPRPRSGCADSRTGSRSSTPSTATRLARDPPLAGEPGRPPALAPRLRTAPAHDVPGGRPPARPRRACPPRPGLAAQAAPLLWLCIGQTRPCPAPDPGSPRPPRPAPSRPPRPHRHAPRRAVRVTTSVPFRSSGSRT